MADLLSTADALCRYYFHGGQSKYETIDEYLVDLRVAVEAEKKRRSKEDTTRITKPKDHEHG